jgi:hypothetical protein
MPPSTAGKTPTAPPASLLPEPVWLTDYAAAQQTARQTGKPLFVVFRCER